VKAIGPRVGSVKRMWVADAARGLGVGRRMLQALEAQARRLKLKMLRLETNRALSEAIALYRSAGFHQVPPFNDDPYADYWFEKRLRARPPRRGAG
jgi:GNAT superfamily N-acetyltransferase